MSPNNMSPGALITTIQEDRKFFYRAGDDKLSGEKNRSIRIGETFIVISDPNLQGWSKLLSEDGVIGEANISGWRPCLRSSGSFSSEDGAVEYQRSPVL